VIDLPENILLRTVTFLDGANGYKMQCRVNEDLGLYVTSERESRHDPFIHAITMDGVEGIFGSIEDLREAVDAINLEATI
jgi:hypothetical protein